MTDSSGNTLTIWHYLLFQKVSWKEILYWLRCNIFTISIYIFRRRMKQCVRNCEECSLNEKIKHVRNSWHILFPDRTNTHKFYACRNSTNFIDRLVSSLENYSFRQMPLWKEVCVDKKIRSSLYGLYQMSNIFKWGKGLHLWGQLGIFRLGRDVLERKLCMKTLKPISRNHVMLMHYAHPIQRVLTYQILRPYRVIKVLDGICAYVYVWICGICAYVLTLVISVLDGWHILLGY